MAPIALGAAQGVGVLLEAEGCVDVGSQLAARDEGDDLLIGRIDLRRATPA